MLQCRVSHQIECDLSHIETMMWMGNKEMGSSMCFYVDFRFGEECGLVEYEIRTSTYFPKVIIHMHYNTVCIVYGRIYWHIMTQL